MVDAHRSHECNCQKNWDDIEFTEARRLSDGGVGLVHVCETHADEECVHVLGRDVVAKIMEAMRGS